MTEDPGLQPQRTTFAWTRTGIGCAALTGILIRHLVLTGRTIDIVATALAGVTTVLVLGLIAAMGTLRDALVNELADLAGAAQSINQSYTVRNPNYLNCSRHFAAGYSFLDDSKLPADPTPGTNP